MWWWEGRAPAGDAPVPMQGVAPSPVLLCHPPAEPGPDSKCLGAGDPKQKLGLGCMTLCVTALGWRPEIWEPPCHSWMSPGRRCTHLRGMSLECGWDLGAVVACRGPRGLWKLWSWVFAGTKWV